MGYQMILLISKNLHYNRNNVVDTHNELKKADTSDEKLYGESWTFGEWNCTIYKIYWLCNINYILSAYLERIDVDITYIDHQQKFCMNVSFEFETNRVWLKIITQIAI